MGARELDEHDVLVVELARDFWRMRVEDDLPQRIIRIDRLLQINGVVAKQINQVRYAGRVNPARASGSCAISACSVAGMCPPEAETWGMADRMSGVLIAVGSRWRTRQDDISRFAARTVG